MKHEPFYKPGDRVQYTVTDQRYLDRGTVLEVKEDQIWLPGQCYPVWYLRVRLDSGEILTRRDDYFRLVEKEIEKGK